VSIRLVAVLVFAIAAAGCGLPDLFPDPDVPVPSDLPFDPDLDPPRDTPGPTDPGNRDPGVDPGADPGVPDTGCVRDCYFKVCGPDGCGGTCGTCPDETACSADQGRCILKASQQPLGGPCGQNAYCEPFIRDPFSTDGWYLNTDWPRCLNDQCREGDCVFGVCSRPCTVGVDVVVNGTDMPFGDGIEDPGVVGGCEGAVDGPYGTAFTCVQVTGLAAGEGRALCLPRSGFAPCAASGPCPDGETCGYIQVRENIEARCLAAPDDGVALGGACGHDARYGVDRNCASWNCSEAGCTVACDGDAACVTAGASCRAGRCAGSGKACLGDSDCSAWGCSSQILLAQPPAAVNACAPRDCVSDADCGDPGYYCLHRATGLTLTAMSTAGRCAPRLAGGAAVGEPCEVSPGDGVPDRPCANEAYCIDGRCGAMCGADADCAPGGGQRCGRVDVASDLDEDGAIDITLSVPMCVWLGAPGTDCAFQGDCDDGTCTPWGFEDAAGAVAVDLACMEAPAGAFPFGSPCGVGASGATCATRSCLDERPDVAQAGVCSQPCRDRGDCPATTAVGGRVVRWACEARPFSRSGTLLLADDRYVSWCVPVPGGSSMAPCADTAWCPDPAETCRAFVRTGAPGEADAVEYACVRPESGLAVGQVCDARGDGGDCATGWCVPTALKGVGYCSRVCASDFDCTGIAGGAAVCASRVVVPRAEPQPSLAVPVCRPVGACIVCRDDRDCDAGFRCADLSPYTFTKDLRCVAACDDDQDCPAESPTCTEVKAPAASFAGAKTTGCLPVACPE